MFPTRLLALAACLSLGCPLLVQAQGDDLKAVLRKAIDAHGGAKLLSKHEGGTSRFKGTIKLMNKDVPLTGESAFQKPDKFRNSMTLEIMERSIEVVQVFDGKSFWVSAMGKTTQIKDEKILKEVRETIRAEGGGGFLDMLKGGYELSSVGEVKVKGKDAIGIRAVKKGQRDVNYFFDKKTHRLLKTEQRALDPNSGKEFTQEKFITEYQKKDGLLVPRRMQITRDSEPFMDLEITEVNMGKPDKSLFTRP